jgi:hypothetical protein
MVDIHSLIKALPVFYDFFEPDAPECISVVTLVKYMRPNKLASGHLYTLSYKNNWIVPEALSWRLLK